MAILATDAFTRANAADLGANWTRMPGVAAGEELGIQGNAADVVTASTDCGDRYSAISWPNDQYSKATISNLASSLGVMARCATSGATKNFYAGGNNVNEFGGLTTDIHLWKVVAGVVTQLGSTGAGILAIGDTVEIRAQGTTITLLVNGVSKVTATDSAHATGAAGLMALHTFVNLAIWDNWEGGDFVDGQPTMRRWGGVPGMSPGPALKGRTW